jgi:indole-3-glycerol phosphate synthase
MPDTLQPPMPDVLASICADTRAEVARRKAQTSQQDLQHRIAHMKKTPPRGFGHALKEVCASGRFSLIAEIKKASPSGGVIREDFDAATLARTYAAAGATCLSVLTEKPHFQGSIEDLVAAHNAVKLPVLRKDFILDPWQIYESRAMGADCILLIMAALTDAEARELELQARLLDMDVLAEVHDERELERALGLMTPLIGINNRNLKTLQTDMETTIRLAPEVPVDRFLVTESGIGTHDDLVRLAEVGVRAFLVGESLMRQPDVGVAVRALLGTDG